MQADRPGLGPAVLGGIIGAAVGVGLNVVLEGAFLGRRIEASWFPVVIGVLTGLGVRLANRHHMNRSYARGAVSALIALAAIVASSFAIKEVMARRETQAKATPNASAPKADADEAADDAAGEGAAAEAAAPEPMPDRESAGGRTGVIGQPKGPNDINPWQFVFMALGALVAYELGRGPDPAKRAAVEAQPEEPLVAGTDPSN
jgi:hypothetical protein